VRGKFLIPPKMRTGFRHPTKESRHTLPEIGDEVGEKVGNFFKSNYNPKDNVFVKDKVEGRSVNNLWTGYKLGGKANIAVTASLLGGGTLIASNPRNLQNSYDSKYIANSDSEAQDVESLQSTRSDGQGYQAQIGSAANLSTSGDLVFAMHKTRHSGQL
jgi:hypothetical protein